MHPVVDLFPMRNFASCRGSPQHSVFTRSRCNYGLEIGSIEGGVAVIERISPSYSVPWLYSSFAEIFAIIGPATPMLG